MLQPLGSLSGGNQQKVAVARVLANHPCLVILEQPTRGLDIRARERLYQAVRSMSSQGVTFVALSMTWMNCWPCAIASPSFTAVG